MTGDAAIGPLMLEGAAHHRAGRLDEAAACYRRVLHIAPDTGDALHLLGLIAHRRGDLDGAIGLVRRAVAASPDDAEFGQNLAQLLCQSGRTAEAADALRALLAQSPDEAVAWGRLAALLRDLGRWEEAIAAARRVVALHPELAPAHVNLGSLLRSAGEPDEAAAVLSEAVRLDPAPAAAWLNLGNALADAERRDEAAPAYRRALEREPTLLPALSGLGLALAGTAPDDAERREAVECLGRYLDRDPEDAAGASLALSALGERPPPARAPAAHVRELYARRAAGWDAKIGGLDHYPGLTLIRDAVERALAGRHGLDILDAGCGTGICGGFLRPFAGRLAGVDLSPEMLARASSKGFYDDLIACDLFEVLTESAERFDAVVAAAVLIHIGDAASFFRAAAAALKPGGVVAVSLLVGEGDGEGGRGGVRVVREGVYLHDPEAIAAAAAEAGLTLLSLDRGVHEYGADGPAEGLAAAWSRPAG